MEYKYTYPVIDRSLRNFLIFMFVLMAVVAVTMAIQIIYGVGTSGLLSEAQPMGFIDPGEYE